MKKVLAFKKTQILADCSTGDIKLFSQLHYPHKPLLLKLTQYILMSCSHVHNKIGFSLNVYTKKGMHGLHSRLVAPSRIELLSKV